MNFEIIADNLWFLLSAALLTIKITILSFIVALFISFIVGTMRCEKIPNSVEKMLSIYVEIFRGTPLLIQLFFIYYGLPSVGINMPGFLAAILGLALNSAAYMSEIIRASINAVPMGQKEASFVLGYNRFQSLLHIVYPQAIRVAIPPLMNSFSSLLKESSLVSVLAITELTRIGNLIYTRTYRAFEIYLTLGIIYFVMTYTVSVISKKIEKRINKAYVS
ncbi:permease [Desulfocucumis palustris]|uniref:Permease n=1 Tax=Desulfocucumis palustris TaxID=1898651 RepID=A0A2L2XC43_9FIRM|nr:amino acid ABC transporter permease [Desulfocucumis palustris]GBF33795.1 permease [Desulfocucumis palustris]